MGVVVCNPYERVITRAMITRYLGRLDGQWSITRDGFFDGFLDGFLGGRIAV